MIKKPSHKRKAEADRALKDLLAKGPVDAVLAHEQMGLSKFTSYRIRDKLGAKTTQIHGWPRVFIWHYPDQIVNPDDFADLIAARTKEFHKKTKEYRAQKSQPDTRKQVMGKARKECIVSRIPNSEFNAKVENAREAESCRNAPDCAHDIDY